MISHAEFIETLETKNHMPWLEGRMLEYKVSLKSCAFSKVVETVCAFLNTEGGRMVFGVEDTSLQIKGISNDSKVVDCFINEVDGILQNASIISEVTKKPPRPQQLLCDRVVCKNGKYVVVITVTTHQEHKEYITKTGAKIFRLNASNYNETSKNHYTQAEVDSILYSNKKNYESLLS